MQHAWVTDSVLCSARKEGGSVSARAARACRHGYLEAQLDLLPHAVVATLGSKGVVASPTTAAVVQQPAARSVDRATDCSLRRDYMDRPRRFVAAKTLAGFRNALGSAGLVSRRRFGMRQISH